MAVVFASGIGLFGLVASGWYLGITYIKNKIIPDVGSIVDRYRRSRPINEDIELFNLSDDDLKEPRVFYDPLPIGWIIPSCNSMNNPVNDQSIE